jgi:hypothetical protein
MKMYFNYLIFRIKLFIAKVKVKNLKRKINFYKKIYKL